MPTKRTPKLVEEFNKSFGDAMDRDRAELAKKPKVHDHTKGEVVDEVDPKRADRHLEES